MNKKNIFLGIVFAIGVGIVFGVIIGAASGLFNSNSLNGDAKPGVTTTNTDETPIKNGLEDETERQIENKNNSSSSSSSSSTSNSSTSTTGQNGSSTTSTSTAQPTIEQPKTTQNQTTATTTQNTTTQTPQTPAQSTRNGVVATGNGASLNVRSSSDPNSAIISQASDGRGLTLYESANGMVRGVTANGVEGWVSEQYVAG